MESTPFFHLEEGVACCPQLTPTGPRGARRAPTWLSCRFYSSPSAKCRGEGNEPSLCPGPAVCRSKPGPLLHTLSQSSQLTCARVPSSQMGCLDISDQCGPGTALRGLCYRSWQAGSHGSHHLTPSHFPLPLRKLWFPLSPGIERLSRHQLSASLTQLFH